LKSNYSNPSRLFKIPNPVIPNTYLAAGAKQNQKPNKPYSSNLMLRIPSNVHAAAEASGKSLNQWAAGILEVASKTH